MIKFLTRRQAKPARIGQELIPLTVRLSAVQPKVDNIGKLLFNGAALRIAEQREGRETMAEQREGNGGDEPSISFDYIKSQQFRVIRADGAIGAVTPSGDIHFALWSERPAIPRQIVCRLNADGTLGEEIPERRVSRGGMVREMDVDVFVSLAAAQQLCDWLQQKIQDVKSRQAGAPQAEEP